MYFYLIVVGNIQEGLQQMKEHIDCKKWTNMKL